MDVVTLEQAKLDTKKRIATVPGIGISAFQDLVAQLDAGVGDVNWMILSDSTAATVAAWVDKIIPMLAARFPAVTIAHRKWTDGTPGSYAAAVTTPGTGTTTLTIWNASVAGKTWQYHFDASRWPTMLAHTVIDAVYVSLGHNDNPAAVQTGNTTLQRAKALGFMEHLRTMHPSAEIVIGSQNPLTAYPQSSQYRGGMLRRLAPALGARYVDIVGAFLADGRSQAELVSGDGTHPTDAGYTIWANRVMAEFTVKSTGRVQPRQAPGFTAPRFNFIADPTFSTYDGVSAPGGWTFVNLNHAADTTNFETGNKGIKLTKAATGLTAYMEYALPIEQVKGRTVIAMVRMRIPAASTGLVGQVVLRDNSSSPGSETWTQPDQFFWRAMVMRVSSTGTLARCRLMVDPTTSATLPEMTVDRIGVAIGDLGFDPNPDASKANAADVALAANSQWLPSDLALKSWAFDPALIANVGIPPAGTLTLSRLKWQRGATLSGLVVHVGTAGAGLVSGQCFIAAYDSNLNLLGVSASQHTNWQTTGMKGVALTAPAANVQSDTILVAVFWNGTTGPAFSRGGNSQGVNGGLSAFRFATADTGLTAAPPAVAAALTATGMAYWAAAS